MLDAASPALIKIILLENYGDISKDLSSNRFVLILQHG
jgi:hypothetical protein